MDADQSVRQATRGLLHVDTTSARLTREILGVFLENVTVLRGIDGRKEVRIKYRFFKPLHVETFGNQLFSVIWWGHLSLSRFLDGSRDIQM
jgi:hypothetical protein